MSAKQKNKQKRKEISIEQAMLPVRDYLAVERTVLANERTVLAYLRTALTIIVAGVTGAHYFQSALYTNLSLTFGSVGLILLVFGIVRFRQVQKKLYFRNLKEKSKLPQAE
jgi:putative membrane protein